MMTIKIGNSWVARAPPARHIEGGMNLNQGYLSQSFLLANCVWGGVASGYMIYGWRQKALIPFIGGLAMGAVSFFVVSALLMSLASIAIMLVVWWLCKHGY